MGEWGGGEGGIEYYKAEEEQNKRKLSLAREVVGILLTSSEFGMKCFLYLWVVHIPEWG